MKDEEIDKMVDNFVNAQGFTKVYGIARKAECGAFWRYGFLVGLKAGRPQWHDLRKDPNDLPKEEKAYIVKAECIMFPGITTNLVATYCKEYKRFAGDGLSGLLAIKWKEID